jgi:uncharacterized protein (DUF58 family)
MSNTEQATGEDLIFSSLDALIQQQQSARLLQQVGRHRKAARQLGNHHVRHLGRGMEFAESRPYSPGDDIRSMDWKVTARTGEPHTKLFEEERERPVLLWCDFRPGMFFATQGQFKSVVMTELASLIAWKSWLDGDRIGGMLVAANNHDELRPARSKSAVLHLLQQLSLESKQMPGFSDQAPSLAESWKRLHRVISPGCQVTLLSDFRGLDESAEQQLKRIARRATVTLIVISDPFEHQLPARTRLSLSDGLRFLKLNTAKDKLHDEYQQRSLSHLERLQQLAVQCYASLITISTQDDTQQRLAKLRGVL